MLKLRSLLLKQSKLGERGVQHCLLLRHVEPRHSSTLMAFVNETQSLLLKGNCALHDSDFRIQFA